MHFYLESSFKGLNKKKTFNLNNNIFNLVYDMPVITEGAKDSPTVCDVAVQAYVGSFDLTIAAILLIEIIFRVVTVVLYCFI